MCILPLFCFSIISRIESLAWTGLSPNFLTAIRPFYFDTNSAAELIARNKHAARRNGRNGNGGASLPAASRDTLHAKRGIGIRISKYHAKTAKIPCFSFVNASNFRISAAVVTRIGGLIGNLDSSSGFGKLLNCLVNFRAAAISGS